jgi:Spy/CpxP family protein refolding chaperone
VSATQIKPWLLLALIFIVGIVTGSALTILLRPHFERQPGGGSQMKTHLLERLNKKLDLTADQQAKIDPIISDAVSQAQKLHHDEMAHMRDIMETANRQISTLLTPDQQTKLQALQAEDQKEFSRHMHNGGGAPHGGPGAPSTPNTPPPAQ